jgi:hypothetical protein
MSFAHDLRYGIRVLAKSPLFTIARVDRTQTVSRVRTMEQVAAEATARPRFRAQLVSAFAAVAAALAPQGSSAS